MIPPVGLQIERHNIIKYKKKKKVNTLVKDKKKPIGQDLLGCLRRQGTIQELTIFFVRHNIMNSNKTMTYI
jgi:hypothetical protein